VIFRSIEKAGWLASTSGTRQLTEIECRRKLGYTPRDELESLRYIAGNLLSRAPFTDQYDHPFRIEELEKRMEHLAWTRTKRGQEATLKAYTAALAMDPGGERVRLRLAGLLDEMSQWSAALSEYSRYFARSPGSSASHAAFGDVYAKVGRRTEALAEYGEALALNPMSAGLFVVRGTLLGSGGDHRRALDDFLHAAFLDPGYAPAFFSAGIAYMKLKELPRARECFDKAIALEPAKATAYYHRALVFTLMGDRKAAAADMRRAEDLGYPAKGK
jgi:tetratricopeptide (TPR) repeat protein